MCLFGALWESFGAVNSPSLTFLSPAIITLCSTVMAETQAEVGPLQEHVFGRLFSENPFSLGSVTAGSCNFSAVFSVFSAGGHLECFHSLDFHSCVFTLPPWGCGSELLISPQPLFLEPTLQLWLPWPQASWDDLKPPGVLQIWNNFPRTLRTPSCLTFLGCFFISLGVCRGYFWGSVVFTVCFPSFL